MIAGRCCRGAGINTLRACSTAAAVFRASASLSLLPSTKTCISRAPTPLLRRITIAERRSHFATMAVNTPYVTLNDGNKMPQVGFGLWKVDNATCADSVYNAIKAGYRLFDGACGMSLPFSPNFPFTMERLEGCFMTIICRSTGPATIEISSWQMTARLLIYRWLAHPCIILGTLASSFGTKSHAHMLTRIHKLTSISQTTETKSSAVRV